MESDKNTKYATGWDKMQSQLYCCGIMGYKDWSNINRSIPSSCCKNVREFLIDCSKLNIFILILKVNTCIHRRIADCIRID